MIGDGSIDFDFELNDKKRMKALKAKQPRKPVQTTGEKWAAEARAKCNKLTRAERDELMKLAMQLAYGAPGEIQSNSGR